MYFNNGEFELAEEGFTEIIRSIDPSDKETTWSVYGLRALCRFQLGQLEDAIADTSTALDAAVGAAQPETISRLYYQRGMFHLTLDDSDSHIADFSNAYRYDPKHELDPLKDDRHLP